MILKIIGSGTSTGIPLPACDCKVCTSGKPKNIRMKPSALLKLENGKQILIDAGTDLRHQALKYHIKVIDAVLFTHAHADHIFGIDDLRGYNFILKSSIPCYGTKNTFEELKRCFGYIFEPDPHYEGGALAKLDLFEIEEQKPFELFGTKIEPFLLMHGKIRVTGFRFGDIAYATDCNFIPEESKKTLKGVKYLVLDGLRYEKHGTHFTIPEAIEAATEIGAKITYLTHMTHSVDHDEVSAKLPAHVKLAYDGLDIEADPPSL